MDAGRILRVFYPAVAQLREKYALVAELEGGTGRPAALSDPVSLGHGTRRRHLHHQPPGRNDNEAPDGGFGGPQHPQHGAVEAVRNPPHCLRSINPQHGEQGPTMPLSASLLRLMAKSQSMCFLFLR